MPIKQGYEVLIRTANIRGRVVRVQPEAEAKTMYLVLPSDEPRWYREPDLEAVADIPADERKQLGQGEREVPHLLSILGQWHADRGNELLIAQISNSLKKLGIVSDVP